MNSEKMVYNYSSSNEIKYGAHYVTLASESVSYENPTGKFIMSYVTPGATDSNAYDSTIPKNSSGNIVNTSNGLGLERITSSNYIELKVPLHMFYITNLTITPNTYGCGSPYGSGIGGCNPKINITRKIYSKGQRFVVVNAGGEIDEPCIVGVV